MRPIFGPLVWFIIKWCMESTHTWVWMTTTFSRKLKITGLTIAELIYQKMRKILLTVVWQSTPKNVSVGSKFTPTNLLPIKTRLALSMVRWNLKLALTKTRTSTRKSSCLKRTSTLTWIKTASMSRESSSRRLIAFGNPQTWTLWFNKPTWRNRNRGCSKITKNCIYERETISCLFLNLCLPSYRTSTTSRPTTE